MLGCTPAIDSTETANNEINRDEITQYILESSKDGSLRACVVIDDVVYIFPNKDDQPDVVAVRNYDIQWVILGAIMGTAIAALLIIVFAMLVKGEI